MSGWKRIFDLRSDIKKNQRIPNATAKMMTEKTSQCISNYLIFSRQTESSQNFIVEKIKSILVNGAKYFIRTNLWKKKKKAEDAGCLFLHTPPMTGSEIQPRRGNSCVKAAVPRTRTGPPFPARRTCCHPPPARSTPRPRSPEVLWAGREPGAAVSRQASGGCPPAGKPRCPPRAARRCPRC